MMNLIKDNMDHLKKQGLYQKARADGLKDGYYRKSSEDDLKLFFKNPAAYYDRMSKKGPSDRSHKMGSRLPMRPRRMESMDCHKQRRNARS